MQPEKKNIKKRAKHLLKEGFNKQDVYSLLVQEFGDGERINDTLKYIAEPELEKKYQWINYVILASLIYSFGMQVQYLSPTIIFNILLIYIVASKSYNLFFIISIAGGLSVLSIAYAIINYGGSILGSPSLYLSLLMAIVHIIYGIMMPKLVAPASKDFHQ